LRYFSDAKTVVAVDYDGFASGDDELFTFAELQDGIFEMFFGFAFEAEFEGIVVALAFSGLDEVVLAFGVGV
jgi:hypothetical protein